MKALVYEEFTRDDDFKKILKIKDIDDPKPKSDEVIFKVNASALNYNDIWGMRGNPVPVPLPHISGSDAAGEVIAIGDQVTHFKIGDRVAAYPNMSCRSFGGTCEACSDDREYDCEKRIVWGFLTGPLWGGFCEVARLPEYNLVKIPDNPNDLRTEIRELHKKIGQKKFYNKLIKLDPMVKKFLLASDSQRSMRAYEVKKLTNKSLFVFMRKTKSNFDNKIFKKLFINIPRELLHKKIDKRVEKMFAEGVVAEVRDFLKMKVNKELSSNKIIGIKEIKDYIGGKITLIKTKELIKLKTRQYAKRQFTWARGHMRSWEMIYAPNSNDLFKQVINKIS